MALVIGLVMCRAIPLFRATQVKLDRINQVMRETLSGVRVIRAFVRTRHEEAALRRREPRPVRHAAPGRPAVRAHPAGDLRDLQPLDGRRAVVRRHPGPGRGAVDRQPDRVPPVPDPDPVRDADRGLHVHPRAAGGGLVGADPRGPRHRALDPRSGAPGRPGPGRPGARRRRVPRRRVRLSRRRAARPPRHLVPGRAGQDDRDRRQHRQRQVDARSTSSRASTTRRRARSSSTASTSATMDREDLWSRIGVIPQKAFLFGGTVASNLRFGDDDATDDELWHALEIAQGQRLRRARWTAASRRRSPRAARTSRAASASGSRSPGRSSRTPAIYIFDDSFSALDFATDARLRAALERELGGATVIIVAQRVGTILNADRIIVMDAGRIVGSGTHRELLESNETYREIVYSQLSEAEAVGMSGATGRGGAAGPGAGAVRARRPARPAPARRPGAARPAAGRAGMIGHGHGPAAGQGQGLPGLVPAAVRDAPAGAAADPRRRRARGHQRRSSTSSARRSWATRSTRSSRARSASSCPPGATQEQAIDGAARARARPSSPTCSRHAPEPGRASTSARSAASSRSSSGSTS